MKEKAPVIIMLATTLGLGIVLVVQHNGAKSLERATTATHQKQVKEFEGRITHLTKNLRDKDKEMSDNVDEVRSLGAKLAASETKFIDTSEKLEDTVKARDEALENLTEKNTALEQNQQELLDTKANVAAVEAKLGDKALELEQIKTELINGKKELEEKKREVVKATQEVVKVTQELGDAKAIIAQSKEALEKKTEQLVAALKELEDGQARIAKLEADLQVVNQQMGGLKTQIGSLEEGIETTQNKLAAAEGDRAFLLRELKRMQNEKAELEKHLNNLEYVREQYKKLKSEWVASERLRRIRDGIGYYGFKNGNVKGVATLSKLAHRGLKPSKKDASPSANIVNENELNVELKNDGTVIIAEPGKKPREVLPSENSPKIRIPSDKGESRSPQTPNPKGIVTPSQEPDLPGGIDETPDTSPVQNSNPASRPGSEPVPVNP